MVRAASSSNLWPHMAALTNPARDVVLQSSESPSVPDLHTSAHAANAKKVES